MPVSSLLLWKQIPARPVERQRFNPDLLFVLRALLLLALAIGYLRPYVVRPRAGSDGGLAVVLDTSASMQVREAAGTRFDQARGRLDTLVAALPPETPVLLVTAADRPRVALRWTADRGRFAEQLAGIAPLDTPTAMGPAVQVALGEASRRGGARVVVLTDLPPAASDLSPAELARIDWIAIGRRGDNVGITRIAVDAPPFGDAADAARPSSCLLRRRTARRHARGEPGENAVAAPCGRAAGAGRAAGGAGSAAGCRRHPRAARRRRRLAVDDEAVGWTTAPLSTCSW
jgi:hypothetical protein